MPELPTLEVFKKYFNNTALNQKITDIKVMNPEILVNTTPHVLEKKLVGQIFRGSRRYGKYLFAHLNNSYHLIIHFGMTGYLNYYQKEEKNHTRFLMSFENGYKLGLVDPRKFGKVGLTTDVDHFIKERKLGPDALEINWKTFEERFKNRKGQIKPLLMNQKFLAGIGNLYADETLYQSRIHPLSRADKLDAERLHILYSEMKRVLKTAVEYDDIPRSLPPSYLLPHRSSGGECPKGGLLERIQVGGRTTYFCPEHQKLYQ